MYHMHALGYKVFNHLELEIQMVMNCHVILRIESVFSARIARAFKH